MFLIIIQTYLLFIYYVESVVKSIYLQEKFKIEGIDKT